MSPFSAPDGGAVCPSIGLVRKQRFTPHPLRSRPRTWQPGLGSLPSVPVSVSSPQEAALHAIACCVATPAAVAMNVCEWRAPVETLASGSICSSSSYSKRHYCGDVKSARNPKKTEPRLNSALDDESTARLLPETGERQPEAHPTTARRSLQLCSSGPLDNPPHIDTMRNGAGTPNADLELTAAELMRYREQYRDGAIDCETAGSAFHPEPIFIPKADGSEHQRPAH